MLMNINSEIVIATGCFITSFCICFFAIPSILRIAHIKGLYDKPDKRKSHVQSVPILGGLAIFAGVILSFSCWICSENFQCLQYIIAASIILLFVGLKDDILIIAPLTKLLGQIAAAFLVVVPGNIRVTNFHFFLGIGEITWYISIPVTMIVIVTLINCYNFADGIDGLAASLGIISSLTLAIYFFLIKEIPYLIIALSLIGSLSAFLRYNLSKTKKIFMGDTGSMLIGLLVSVLLIQFNECNISENRPYFIQSSPAVSFAIVIVPAFDLLRVMFIRKVINRSLSQADQNHIHHKLIRLGIPHIKATLILVAVNVFFIILAFLLAFYPVGVLRLMLILILLAMYSSYIPAYIYERRIRGVGKRC